MKKLLEGKIATFCSAFCLLLFGCQSEEQKTNTHSEPRETDIQMEGMEVVRESPSLEEDAEEAGITRAFAFIDPKEGSNVVGAVTFVAVDDGVRVIAHIGGLPPGKHGFHIHEHGDCSAEDASSAGGHFNPTNKKHGGPDSEERHVGDLGNIVADNEGVARYDRVDSVISLEGEYSILGKSVVIHEEEDDLMSDPTGNSGKRIGCAVILPGRP